MNNYHFKTGTKALRDEKTGRVCGKEQILVEEVTPDVNITLYNPHIHQLHIHNHIDNNNYVKYNILVCSRRFGKSKLSQNQALKWCLSEPNQLVAYITHSLRLCRKFYDEIDNAFTGELRDVTIESTNKTELIIKFKNGSTLQFFSFENSNKIRGFGFNYAVLDEAQNLDSEEFYADIHPTMANAMCKKVLIIGTPNSTDTWFYDYYERGMSEETDYLRYKSFHYTIWDIPNFLMDMTEKRDMEKNYPKDIFKMEWLAEFVDGVISVFKNYLNCIINETSIKPQPNENYFGGLDTGRSDYTVFTILDSKGHMVEQLRVHQLDYYPMAHMVLGLIKKYKVKYTVMEINSIGDAFLSILKKESKKLNVKNHEFIEIFTSNTSKQEYIEELIVAFQNKEIQILNLKDLKKELSKFIMEFSPKTRARVYKGIGSSHDDTVISLALAWKCFKDYKSKLNKEYIKVIKRP